VYGFPLNRESKTEDFVVLKVVRKFNVTARESLRKGECGLMCVKGW
jgi:hypothetical protein